VKDSTAFTTRTLVALALQTTKTKRPDRPIPLTAVDLLTSHHDSGVQHPKDGDRFQIEKYRPKGRNESLILLTI
jgi:hypothetical protein